ncbi:hypothetical protein DYB25_003142 [Aphanomyces astaci]|uniref:Beta-hexosaminidase n=1 Tax=Aphanomyces astaci TaxID=112090 RepID=A0A397C8S3_APHAT|nr:hypothetical protein DYB25_003142 [Aphanomyces astaci]RHY38945.1 hypothetical protein DYB30_009377 [Aphanomyces astaci]RHY78139.1 hypothetical protein DYB34_009695 [Aphanomyces astaci]
MTCGNGSMLPLPQSFKLTTPDTVAVDVESFSHSVTGRVDNSDLLRAMQSAFATELVKKKQLALGGVATAGRSVKVVASIQSSSVKLTLDTDESYDLAIASTTVTIRANTIYGYRHALASLLQLVDWCDLSQSFRMVSAVTIVDKPAYKHRGIMLDTARNFIPVQLMHRLIRTMGMHKLNVLHLHLTDSSSFPLEIKADHRFNQYGLYQSNMAYTQVQVAALVAYAKVHGVKVIPEIDAPAHVGAGWQWGPDYNMGELALCWANNPWMAHCLEAPCGQLNPFNEYVYDLLDLVWTEIGAMFDSDVFHLGGDEVFFECWIDSPVFADKVRNKTNHAEYIEIWATFQERVQNKLWARDPAKRITLWSSDLTTSSYIASLPPDKVSIQSWNMLELNEPKRFTDAGYSYIASFQEAHYLDCGLNGIARKDNGWCAPYKTWQVIYDQLLNPNVTADNNHLVLGGEVVLWTEVTGAAALEDKIWPRAAAFAERAWTNPNMTWLDAMDRMTIAAHRVVESGSGAEMLQPLWCRLNPGGCTLLTN